MRFLETLSKSIFRFAGRKYLGKIRAYSLENVLRKSTILLDQQTIEEIKVFLKNQQTPLGGFADKGGKCSLYYTLFGLFAAEALNQQEVMPSLRKYIKEIIETDDLKGIDLNCAVILFVKLFDNRSIERNLRIKLLSKYRKAKSQQSNYSLFLNLLTAYYLEDYWRLYRIQKEMKRNQLNAEKPCPVTSAQLIIQDCFRLNVDESRIQLNSFYREDGSFSATKRAPLGDLLSTGVALYALKFTNHDLRFMKPDCLNYVDSLYSNGGFCATNLDPEPDVEYTFYGLLALGALAE